LPREEVLAHQRERLFEAMIKTVDERGFVASTISDLVEHAGVSRRTFYEHFENKEQCLLLTYDMLVDRLAAYLRALQMPASEGLPRLEALIKALFEAVVARPDAARLVCVELAAAGPPGIERWAASSQRLARAIGAVLAHGDGQAGIPAPVARAIVGALRKILYSRVRRKRSSRALRGELMKLLPDLMAWIASYHPSPAGIPDQPPQESPPRLRPGGRAPGTLTLAPRWTPRGLPPGEHNLPRGFVAHNQRERIFDAIAKCTSANGYPELGLEAIVAEACISLQTFYQHFPNKEEAFLATYEVGHAKAVAAVSRAVDLHLDWASNVKNGVRALLEFLASEPAYAHLACVDVLIAYPRLARRLDEANHSYAELLDFKLDASAPSRMPSSVAGEAIVGGIFELLHDAILHGRTAQLPNLTEQVSYLALAPFIGAQAAWEAARGS
jgi:AcrR family transcriptional regulator